MIKQTTWHSYWYVIAVILLVYYLVVFGICYPADIKYFLTRKRWWSPAKVVNEDVKKTEMSSDNIPNTSSETGLFTSAKELIRDLNSILQTATRKQSKKDDLLNALQEKISNYPHLKGTDFEIAINNLIVAELQMNTSINLSEADKANLWVSS